MRKANPGEQCCWCSHSVHPVKATVFIFKIKTTSGRIANKRFHKVCLQSMLTARPTTKNATLVRKK